VHIYVATTQALKLVHAISSERNVDFYNEFSCVVPSVRNRKLLRRIVWQISHTWTLSWSNYGQN